MTSFATFRHIRRQVDAFIDNFNIDTYTGKS